MNLMKQEGRDAVYKVFGIMFIESDPGGNVALALARMEEFKHPTGGDELAAIIRSPREKELRGVMGESLGAVTVANFYAKPESKGVRVPFFLDSLPNLHIGVGACIRFLGCHSLTVFDLSVNPAAEAHSKYAGTFSFLSGGRAVPSTLEVKVTA